MDAANNPLLQLAKRTQHALFCLVSNRHVYRFLSTFSLLSDLSASRKPFDGVAYLPLCAILLLLPPPRGVQEVVDSYACIGLVSVLRGIGRCCGTVPS